MKDANQGLSVPTAANSSHVFCREFSWGFKNSSYCSTSGSPKTWVFLQHSFPIGAWAFRAEHEGPSVQSQTCKPHPDPTSIFFRCLLIKWEHQESTAEGATRGLAGCDLRGTKSCAFTATLDSNSCAQRWKASDRWEASFPEPFSFILVQRPQKTQGNHSPARIFKEERGEVRLGSRKHKISFIQDPRERSHSQALTQPASSATHCLIHLNLWLLRDENNLSSFPALTERLQEIKLNQRSVLYPFSDKLCLTWTFSASFYLEECFG